MVDPPADFDPSVVEPTPTDFGLSTEDADDGRGGFRSRDLSRVKVASPARKSPDLRAIRLDAPRVWTVLR
jgi:hypothetical protein